MSNTATDLVTVEAAPIARRPPPAPMMAFALPRDLEQTLQVAEVLAASGMFKHRTKAAAFAAISIGAELGLPPAASMRAVDIVDGKPAPSADALLAACLRRSDVCEYFRCVEDSDTHSTWVAKRVGGVERVFTFTLAMAERAGLTRKDVWVKYGNRMLGHRCVAWLAREVFPDIVLGLYSTDEREEIAEEQRPAAMPARVAVMQAPERDDLLQGFLAIGTPDAGDVHAQRVKLARLIEQATKLPKGERRTALSRANADAKARLEDLAEREAIRSQDAVNEVA